jgi:hypothetical protein
VRPFLTVLTQPIQSDTARVYAGLRRVARHVVKPNAPLPVPSPYPGHHGLVRSVVEGLRQIGADFNFNPPSFSELAKVVYAPANEALRQAAELKRQDTIRTLIAGPTNALLPHEASGVMLIPEIDVLIVASEWVRELTASLAPSVATKLRVCQAGIDPDYWRRTAYTRTRRPVVYWKDSPETLCVDVEDVVMAAGLQPVRIKYGDYEADTYKAALDGAPFAVFLSTFETQGLALAEAWAMDVPTLVWDPQTETQWAGAPFRAASSAPFLTGVTGLTWKTLDELEQRVKEVMNAPEQFASRAWVCAHMTDELCARNLYDLIRDAAVGH